RRKSKLASSHRRCAEHERTIWSVLAKRTIAHMLWRKRLVEDEWPRLAVQEGRHKRTRRSMRFCAKFRSLERCWHPKDDAGHGAAVTRRSRRSRGAEQRSNGCDEVGGRPAACAHYPNRH